MNTEQSLRLSKVDARIVTELAVSAKTKKHLVAVVAKELRTTERAVYKALVKLERSGIVVDVHSILSLSVLWINSLQDLLRAAQQGRDSIARIHTELTDFKNKKRRSVTIECDNARHFELIFHNMMYSLTEYRSVARPFYFFGFAPWFFTLFPSDTIDSYMKHLKSLNYEPTLLARESLDRDSIVRKRCTQKNYHYGLVGNNLKENFEGNYFDDICVQAIYDKGQFDNFKKEYAGARLTNPELMKLFLGFTNVKIKVSRKPELFKKKITSIFLF